MSSIPAKELYTFYSHACKAHTQVRCHFVIEMLDNFQPRKQLFCNAHTKRAFNKRAAATCRQLKKLCCVLSSKHACAFSAHITQAGTNANNCHSDQALRHSPILYCIGPPLVAHPLRTLVKSMIRVASLLPPVRSMAIESTLQAVHVSDGNLNPVVSLAALLITVSHGI